MEICIACGNEYDTGEDLCEVCTYEDEWFRSQTDDGDYVESDPYDPDGIGDLSTPEFDG